MIFKVIGLAYLFAGCGYALWCVGTMIWGAITGIQPFDESLEFVLEGYPKLRSHAVLAVTVDIAKAILTWPIQLILLKLYDKYWDEENGWS